MLRNASVGARLSGLVGLLLLLLIIGGIESMIQRGRLETDLERLYRENLVRIGELELLTHPETRALHMAVRAVFGELEPTAAAHAIDQAIAQRRRFWAEYRQRTADQQAPTAAAADRVFAAADSTLLAISETLKKQDREATAKLLGAQQTADEAAVLEAVDALRTFELERARTEVERDLAASVSGRNVMTIVMVAGFAVAVAASVSIVRSVAGPLRDVTAQLKGLAGGRRDLTSRIAVTGSDEIAEFARAFNAMLDRLLGLVTRQRESGTQVASSTASLATSSKQLEATMAEQAASTHQVVASAKGISATAESLVTTMGEVGGLSLAAASSADEGRAGLQRMSDTMHQMEAASRSISDKLETINSRASNITGVVTTIAKIADQTNLLSLNAAIEAAKAGEAGEGFSVVAREIRRLADKTAVATLDIERMVKEMQSAVSAGVMGMEKFSDEVKRAVREVEQVGAQFGRIIEQVHALTPRFESVTRGMETQSVDAGNIRESMIQLSEATRHTADALRETRRAIDQLNAAAHDLIEQEIARFAAAPAGRP
jgi:methyl-accepting chemotaxis protein WspA